LSSSPRSRNIAKAVSELGVATRFIVQDEPTGIADAVIAAAPANAGNFTVLLGDCIIEGTFDPALNMMMRDRVCLNALPNDIKSNYGVRTEHGRVIEAIEKPEARQVMVWNGDLLLYTAVARILPQPIARSGALRTYH